jgi:membrane associated rhomboid family serine protease
MSLVCPKCYSDMGPVLHQGVTVDVCTRCKGLWLDPGELAALRGADQDVPAERIQETHPDPTSYICPRCEGGFETFEYVRGTGLYVDRCKNCHGIWLDAGELQKVRTFTDRKRFMRLETDQEKLRKLIEQQKHKQAAYSTLSPSEDAPPRTGVYLFQLLTGLPVEVSNPRSRFPIITLGLVLSCAAVFVLQLSKGEDLDFYWRFAFVPELFKHGQGIAGLLTSMFLHGSLWHLLGNLYFLWLFGDNVEDRLNRFGYLLFYLFCGVAASLTHALLTDQPMLPTIGASGAISGIMGAYLVLYPKRKMYQIFFFIQFKVSVMFYLLFWLGMQFLFSGIGGGNVAWYAHIGGFLAGVLGIYLFRAVGALKPDVAERA